MLDIQLLRTDAEGVAKRLSDRPYQLDLTAFRAIEDDRKRVQTRTQELQAKRNALNKQIGLAKSKNADTGLLMAEANAVNAELEGLPKELDAVQARLHEFLAVVPNIPHESVPVGTSPEQNVEMRRVGAPRTFGFAPKDHADLGTALGMIDFERAVKIAAARFSMLSGAIARLHRAITQLMLDVHTGEHSYVEVYVPYMVNKESMYGTGQLPKFEEDLFAVPRGADVKFYLIPTA